MDEKRLANYSLILIGIVLIAIILQTFTSVLRPLAIAGLLLVLFVPLGRYFTEKRIPAWAGISAIVVVVILIFGILITGISAELLGVQKKIPAFEETIQESSNSLSGILEPLGIDFSSFDSSRIGEFGTSIFQSVFTGVRTFITELLFSLVFLLFLIPAYRVNLKTIEKSFGKKQAQKFKKTLLTVEDGVRAYLSTKFWISLGTGLTSAFVMFVLSGNAILTSSFIIFAFNFIPIVGSLIAVVLVIVLNFLVAGLTTKLIIMLVLLAIVQFIFGTLLEPKIAGSQLDLSPILILISLAVWSWIWGIVGALIAVPLTLVLKIAIEHVMEK